MPKFLYTVILVAGLFWFLTARMFLGVQPNSTSIILRFLLLLCCAVAFTYSIPAYLILAKKNPNFSNLKFLYRRALKWGFFLGSVTAVFLGLRAFGVASALNLALTAILYAMIFLHFRRSR